MNDVEKIMAELNLAERLTQLAEECAELGQAALKLRRALDGTNPTPVTESQAREAFEEEVGDVLLCMAVTSEEICTDGESWVMDMGVRERVRAKEKRWAGRLEGNAVAAGKGDDLSRRCAPPSPEGEGLGDETERERGHINPEPDRDGEDGEAVNAEMIMEAKRELVRTVIEAIAALLSI